MKNYDVSLFIFVPLLTLQLSGCGNSSTSSTATSSVSASNPATIMSSVSEGVSVAGTGMSSSGVTRSGHLFASQFSYAASLSTSNCNSNNIPQTAAGSSIASSDSDYPYLYNYCAVANNTHSPDSVQGAFEQVEGIACAINKAFGGTIPYDGVSHSVTIW